MCLCHLDQSLFRGHFVCLFSFVRLPPIPSLACANRDLRIISGLGSPGCLGLFAGFNLVAFILVFLYVEETRLISLEDLDFIYAVSKSDFCHYQVIEYLPWLVTKYVPHLLSSYMPGRRDRGVDLEGPEGVLTRVPQPPQLYSYEMRNEKDSQGTGVELADFKLESDDDRM